ncbi:MAG: alpha/beta fold hydrolase [Syntrophales bacterium]|jgi:predicted alpha/beta-fold hydrolase|nr:alpha/beta fold hydrolase [Syntrophales bacterium]MDY0045425.1 alpha/beta fold hydrolase [Syntrophales bacterium]
MNNSGRYLNHELSGVRDNEFRPQRWAKNTHIQSIFASLKIRAAGRNEMVRASKKTILNCGNNVRLLGFHSSQPLSKALVLLLHGWEGSSDSTYVLHSGRYLFREGFDIFRLNLRDHGESHHLNEGIFHGALTEEVVQAVHETARFAKGKPFFIVGFSLGGNFALRVALSHGTKKIEGLRHIFCVSPLLDPYKATLCIDSGLFIYRKYFLKKWKQSLEKKQQLFPHRYNFEDIFKMENTLQMTDILIKRYTDFAGYREYFNNYTLLNNTFADLTIPLTILAAEDDPVIPVKDFFTLQKNESLEIGIQHHGGHCGFLDPFPFGCWYERKIAGLFGSYLV